MDQMDGTDLDGRPVKIKIYKSWDAYRKEKESQGPSSGMKCEYGKDDRGAAEDY